LHSLDAVQIPNDKLEKIGIMGLGGATNKIKIVSPSIEWWGAVETKPCSVTNLAKLSKESALLLPGTRTLTLPKVLPISGKNLLTFLLQKPTVARECWP